MPGRQLHILVVDDSEDDRTLFGEYLARQTFRITKARDGREALAKALELQPHLIIMDLWMPLLSGWDVMRRLKNEPATKQIPILVVTAHSPVRPLESDGFLFKPVRLQELGREVRRILTLRGWEKELSSHLEPGGAASSPDWAS